MKPKINGKKIDVYQGKWKLFTIKPKDNKFLDIFTYLPGLPHKIVTSNNFSLEMAMDVCRETLEQWLENCDESE